MAYGTGTIPFIRTSDLSNGEIEADSKHGVSEELYEEYKDKIDICPGDILMVITQDIIDTLGRRLFEVKIPLPKDKQKQRAIANETRDIVETRVRLRDRARQIALDVEGVRSHVDYEDLD